MVNLRLLKLLNFLKFEELDVLLLNMFLQEFAVGPKQLDFVLE